MGNMQDRLGTHMELGRTMKALDICCCTMFDEIFMPFGITFAQCGILMYLYQQPGAGTDTGELLKTFPVSPASLSGTLKRMKQKGYIRYFNKEDDMRKKQVTLTIKAIEIEKIVTERFRALEDVLYNCLTDSECEETQQVLSKMLKNIQEFIKEERCDETDTGMPASI